MEFFDKIEYLIKKNSFKFRLWTAILMVISIFIIFPSQLFVRKITQPHPNLNFQTVLNINNESIINNKLYKKNNQIYAEFMKKTTYKTRNEVINSTDPNIGQDNNIEQPIYYRYGFSDSDLVYPNGKVSTDYDHKLVDYVGDGYLKLGENKLMNVDEKFNDHKYIIIELYENQDKKTISDTSLPVTIVQYYTNQVLDYLQINDLQTKLYAIKNDKEQRKIYSKWIYSQELNPTLVTSLVDEFNKIKPKLLLDCKQITEKNVLEFIENMYVYNNQRLVNLQIQAQSLGFVNDVYKQNVNYFKQINNDFPTLNAINLNDYFGTLGDLNEQVGLQMDHYFKDNLSKQVVKGDIYDQYNDQIDALTPVQKFYLLSLSIKNN